MIEVNSIKISVNVTNVRSQSAFEPIQIAFV